MIKVLRIYIISSVIKVIDKWVTFKLEKVRNLSAGVFCEGTDNLGRKEQLINDLSEHVKMSFQHIYQYLKGFPC